LKLRREIFRIASDRESGARIMDYVQKKSYDALLPLREVYIKGPGMIFRGNPKKYLTEIQIMISYPKEACHEES